MTSIAFEAALNEPDDDTSNARLCTLISARDYSGPTLPAVAESYLRAFCEIALSVVRRRWVGIALAGMMGHSSAVIAHMRQMGKELQKLGVIIQSNGEQEETKIVAGIVVQQGIEHGIDFGRFWDSDKVKNSAPNFPDKHDARWMSKFQTFLDTLGELAITDPTTDASILYPISLVTSDDYRWRESGNSLPVALIQSGIMTLIAPNEHLEDIQFVEVPITHIQSVRSEPASLHDSQAQETEYKPWDVILALKPGPWSYRLNSVQRTATDITLLFAHSADAQEWKSCIEEHQKPQKELKVRPRMSRSSPIAASSPSGRDLEKRKPTLRASKSRRVDQSVVDAPPGENGDPIIPQPRSRPSRVEKQALPKTASPRPISNSKRATYSKGKLPQISQATKQKALKLIRPQSDDLDMPIDERETEQADLPDASSPATSSTNRSQPPRTTFGQGAAKVKKPRVSQTKHRADDDEDFVPNGPKPKKKTSNKRKSAPDVVADGNPAKKARMRPANDGKATATGTRRQANPKAPVQPPSSVASSRHLLIGGLLSSHMPNKTSGVPFKKPELPARTAQTPSTPTNPRKRNVEALVRPRTPTNVRRRSDNEALPLITSSPPPSLYVTENRSGRLRRAALETEIMSSNSKPVPASPNAESTAISGHADRDEVASEKRTGDFQTAKSDPFSQRTEGPRNDPFTRRLTETGPPNVKIGLTIGLSHSMPVVNQSGPSKAEALDVASQPTPQPMPWQKSSSHPIVVSDTHSVLREADPRKPAVEVNARSPQITDSPSEARQSKQDTNLRDVQKLKQKATPTAEQSSREPSAVVAHDPTQQASVELVQGQTTGPSRRRLRRSQEISGVEMGDSILEGPQQVIDNTQAEHTAQNEDLDMEGDTLPGEDGEDSKDGDDEQPAMDSKTPSVNFPSSPPMPGSPSSHSSTSAEPEPATDPPLPSSQAEEMEWETSLQPHQRALHDLLLRTSKRVMRHIVDNETGVTDIAETFAKDGEHVLNSLLQRHDGDYDAVFQDMESKKKGLRGELERAAKQMAEERQRVNVLA
jgi:hypothetical protein